MSGSRRKRITKDIPESKSSAPKKSRSEPEPSKAPQKHFSSTSSSLSLKSDRSKEENPAFRAEPEPSHSKDPQKLYSSSSSSKSLKSDWSKEENPNFSAEPEPSHSKDPQRPSSSSSSSLSFKSDWSKEENPNFRAEPEPSHSKKRDSSEEEKPPRCWFCRDILKVPVCSSCGPSSGPPSEQRSRTEAGPQTHEYFSLLKQFYKHKVKQRRISELVAEGSEEEAAASGEGGTLLNDIFTELYITEGLREEVHTQHEVRQLETASKKTQASIRCHDIFQNPDGPIRVVLTTGIAGIGKTFLVKKFTLDWAEDLENQDISAVVSLSFRELNLIREEQHSLLTLIRLFHLTLQKIPAEQLDVFKLLFIFDGLDESRLSLDFSNSPAVSDVTQKSSVSVLLTNLIQGRLLPSALIWITTRPAAANQIPDKHLDRLTEVIGFDDSQKEEYFRKRFRDEKLSSRVISHIQSSRSLHVMCRVPIFCWITATVLEHMLTTEDGGEVPRTLTDMYSQFLMVQTKRKKKYQRGGEAQEVTEADREVLLKLGRLAFEHLQKGNIMFYQEDLQLCGLDVTEALLHSGVCTEIFRRECVIFRKPVYSFVHLSVQEFLAAVYMFHCFTVRNTEVLENFLLTHRQSGPSTLQSFFNIFWPSDQNVPRFPTLDEFLSKVMEKSLENESGQLDLFVRFLHGLSVESNQRLLGSLLCHMKESAESLQKVINNLKMMRSYSISPDRSMNIFHCLVEMKDLSVHQEIQEFLQSENQSEKRLSEIHCSALAYMLLMSEEVLDELDLKKYKTSPEGQQRLIPVVRNCRKARLSGCELSEAHCVIMASALKSRPSHLTELDLSHNTLQDPGMKILSDGLQSPNCRLETLRLRSCTMSEEARTTLVSSLKSSHLQELDLSANALSASAVKHLCGFLQSSHCTLKTLRLSSCRLSESSCAALVSALKTNPSHLTELDLSDNVNLLDSGVKLLCGFLQSPRSKLRILRLRSCSLSVRSCADLVSVLEMNPSHLTQLDLSDNKLQDDGVEQLCGFLKVPDCRLETLRLEDCSLTERSCAVLASALTSIPSRLTHLDLSFNKLRDPAMNHLRAFLRSPRCNLHTLRLEDCRLSATGCSALFSALKSSSSRLTELDLSRNDLKASDVQELLDLVKRPDCKLETLRWNC
ncbi:hypothetical protein OJAV_G00083180 [Oryzias javanicus]|uniref:NACHT domain-containing protein n=1 Tax=Oryzias javanicus TaxID=123683 RepID=A0A3S2PUF3_ORYJA|nr:hypothetical protein OJAV_G00083180 [Oryzias javanicus]